MVEDTGPKRILVFDDDADFRALLRNHLGTMFEGVDVQEYDPVARGIPGEDFDWSRFDVLILDYYLSIHNVTGLDILQANRRNKFFPATIMLTGAGNEEVAVRAVKAGVYDYLRKEKLDKEQLKRAILSACEQHREEQQRLSELTNQSLAFNKALFYQKLENIDDDGKDRALLLIELDDAAILEERLGAILRDNIVRHIAHRSFEVFQVGECHPHITRLGDAAVAILIDKHASAKTLEFNMEGLCDHLKKRPYKFDEKKFRFTVSIGIVEVPRAPHSADDLIQQARLATGIAARTTGRNSFHLLRPASDAAPVAIPEAGPAQEMAESPPAIAVDTGSAAARQASEPAQKLQRGESRPVAPPEQAAGPDSGAARQIAAPQAGSGLGLEPISVKPERQAEPPVIPAQSVPAPAKASAPPRPADQPPKPPATPRAPEVKAAAPVAKPAAATKAPAASVPPAPASRPPTKETPKPPASTPPAKAAIAASKPAPAAPARPTAPAAAPPRPAAAPTKPAATAPRPKPGADEIDVDQSTLGEEARKIRRAFAEKRVVQTFQPIMPLFNEDGVEVPEVYRVHMQLIDRDGSIKPEDYVYAEANTPDFQKFIDRWLLRETIGRVINNPKTDYLFMIRISESSLADPGLFNWLRKLLGGLDKQRPGKSIALEMAASEFANQQKKANALIAYLGKSQGFRFVLAGLREPGDAWSLGGSESGIDLIRVGHEMLQKLKGMPPAPGAKGSLLDGLVGKGMQVIVDDIQDATMLTNIIGAGAHFAMGTFIGEPLQHIEDSTNVESFEIT